VIAVISGAGGISFNNGTKHTFTGTGTTAGKQGSSDPYLGLTQLTLDPSSLTWDGGGGNGNWDINTTANFSGHQYTDGSVVTFGDTSATGGSVSNTNPITIASGGVQPSSVTFTNLTAIYKFQTSGTIGIGGDGSVSITGGGTVILSSPNIYSAGTFITSGTLKAASGSLNSTGAVTIGASGKLYVGDGSSSAGTLSTGAQTWTAGGCYLPKVSGDGTADLLTIGTSVDPVGGTLTLNGTGAFDIVPQVGAVALGQTSEHWELAAFNSTITGYTGTLPSATGVANGAGVNSQFALNTSALSEPGADFSLSLVELPSGDDALYLNYTGTPEPSTGMLIIAGGATMLHRRRRK
jgi:autotransporter-associated beta strand protein